MKIFISKESVNDSVSVSVMNENEKIGSQEVLVSELTADKVVQVAEAIKSAHDSKVSALDTAVSGFVADDVSDGEHYKNQYQFDYDAFVAKHKE